MGLQRGTLALGLLTSQLAVFAVYFLSDFADLFAGRAALGGCSAPVATRAGFPGLTGPLQTGLVHLDLTETSREYGFTAVACGGASA